MKHLIRIADLASSGKKRGVLPMSRATILRMVREGNFPQPYKLSAGVTAWDQDLVEQWLAKKMEPAK